MMLDLLGAFWLVVIGLLVPWAFMMGFAMTFEDPTEKEGWVRAGLFTGVIICFIFLAIAMHVVRA